MSGIRDRRSLLNFGVLIIVAMATTIFVLNKANEAIAEIDGLNDSAVYLGSSDRS